MEQPSGQPDLQSILATLAQYSGQGSNETKATLTGSTTLRQDVDVRNGHHTAETVTPERSSDLHARPQGRASAAAPAPRPMIDPATITVWQDGLRCVTKIAAQNAQFAQIIKRMMKNQRDHEMRWYAERQSLKQTQANRSASSAKAQSILKSLNASFAEEEPADGESSESARAKELADHDRKIYNAQLAMEEAMTAELKSLGVPFFGTDKSLVVADDYDVSKEQLPESHAKWSPLVTETQLRDLQRKMVNHLEDLYRD